MEYGLVGGPRRGTSTTRTDTGNGACEVVYLTEIERLATMRNGWRTLFWVALWALLGGLVAWFRIPYANWGQD